MYAMKMRLFLLGLVLVVCPIARAQYVAVSGNCELPGQAVLVSGLAQSGTRPLSGSPTTTGSGAMASYPQCRVTVYPAGNGTPVPTGNVYSNSTGTVLGNPFTANTDGSWTFYAAQACYDVVLSSGSTAASQMPASKTLSGKCAGSGGGGGGSISEVDTVLPVTGGPVTSGVATIGVNGATGSTTGVVQLTADFGGTATVPTVVNGSHITNNSIDNTGLLHPSLTVTAGTGLTGGGTVALGGAVTLNLGNVNCFTAPGGGNVLCFDGVIGANEEFAMDNSVSSSGTGVELTESGVSGMWITGSVTNTTGINGSPVELSAGESQNASPGHQGLLITTLSYVKGATNTQWNLQCGQSTQMQAQDCGASPTNILGVEEGAHTSTIVVANTGQVPINASAAVTLGHTVCAGSTAGEVTDSGGTGSCPAGQVMVGTVVATSGTWGYPDAVSFTASTTRPLIQLSSFGSPSAGSGSISGSGTSGTIPIWTGTSALGNSGITFSASTYSFANGISITGQESITGRLQNYNGDSTVSNGVTSNVGLNSGSSFTGNMSPATIFTVPASGTHLYRINCYLVIQTAGGVSSTLPSCQVSWTDATTSVVETATLSNTSGSNTVGTYGSGSLVISPSNATTVTVSTTGYASSGSSMSYIENFVLEKM